MDNKYRLYYHEDSDLWMLVLNGSATTTIELQRLKGVVGWFNLQDGRLEEEPFELLYEFEDLEKFLRDNPDLLI